MRFCQTDGTALVEAAPAVDPYKTMVARPEDLAAAIPPATPAAPEPQAEEEVLQIPPIETDPKKTMYVSEAELRGAMQEADGPDEQVMDLSPPPPAFIEQEAAPFGDKQDSGISKTTPPIPSPFGTGSAEIEQPAFAAREPEAPSFIQAEPPAPASNPFNEPAPIEKADFSPTPAAPQHSRQPEEMQNPQYQPGSGLAAAGQNKTLAIVSLVAGILGLTLCCGTLLPSLIAIVTGFMARGKASGDPVNYGGGGLAVAGLITGVLGLLAGIAYLVFVFFPGRYANYHAKHSVIRCRPTVLAI